ncbi:hypothetical protein [Constantimarinum furrinae]|nr:hypothetical protein [Constantimarinum furrinae]
MKASTQYTDFTGYAAADISDYLGSGGGDDLARMAKFFKLDTTRFKIVGISIYGTEDPHVSLYCVDKKQSTDEKEHIVSMSVHIEEKNILPVLFKRLHIVLHDKYDKKYPEIDYDEEVRFSDFHETEDDD